MKYEFNGNHLNEKLKATILREKCKLPLTLDTIIH